MAEVFTGLRDGIDGTNNLYLEKDEQNVGNLVHLVWINPADNGHYPVLSFRYDGSEWDIHTQPLPVGAPINKTANDGNGYAVVTPG